MTTPNDGSKHKKTSLDKIFSEDRKTHAENATDKLQKYIEQFKDIIQTKSPATPSSRCYGSSNVSLLSTTPKAISLERKAGNSTKNRKIMSRDLVRWVNESYSKDLQRKIVPFGQRSNSSVDTFDTFSQTEGDDESNSNDISTVVSDGDVQLSTLPSPDNSVVSDLDSNMGSISTDTLVKSHPQYNNFKQPQGKTANHPSWVEELVTAKNYPNWLDDVDQTLINEEALMINHNQKSHLSRSLSPSFFRKHSPPNLQSPHLTSFQKQSTEISSPQQRNNIAWDLESTSTDALISESIYGQQPVNMGGTFHSSLYHDRTIQQLHEHSVRKFAKDSEKTLVKEMSFLQTPVKGKKTRNNSIPSAQRLQTPRGVPNSKTPSTKYAKKNTTHSMKSSELLDDEEHQENITQRGGRMQGNTRNIPSKEPENRPSSLHLARKKDVQSTSEIRKNSADSSTTDKLMRKSPTGIEMCKKDSKSRSFENSTGKNARSKKAENRISEKFPSVIHSRTENGSHSRKDLPSPNVASDNASEKLQKIIEQAERDLTRRSKKDHYLSGKVSKKDLTIEHRNCGNRNHDRLIVSQGRHYNNSQHSRYPTKTDSGKSSSRGLDPLHKYLRQLSTQNENSSSEDHGMKSHEKTNLRTKVPWNSDPTRFKPGSKTRGGHFRSRIRTKSAPQMKGDFTVRESLRDPKYVFREDLRARSSAHYASNKRISSGQYAKERTTSDAYYSDERDITNAVYANEISPETEKETESVDTEALVIKPPMPLFDVSPSLSTESVVSSTGSGESEDTLIENLALRTSFLATDNDLPSSSGTSYLELSISPQRPTEKIPVEEEETPRFNVSNKPGIITSFLEDCMRSNEEADSVIHSSNGKFQSPYMENEESLLSEEETNSERPVETLKKMLFTVQGLTCSSDEKSDVNDCKSLETQSERLTEEVLSEILSTVSQNEGQDSLSRAYYHLARLKKLVSASREVAAWK